MTIRQIDFVALLLATVCLASCGRVDQPQPTRATIQPPRRNEPAAKPQRLIAELPPEETETPRSISPVEAPASAAPVAKSLERPHSAPRQWNSADGNYHTSAIFIALIDDQVRLRKLSGDFVNVPLASLAGVDRQFVKEQIRTDPAARVILGKVIGVTDGDTITVLDESKLQHRVRLEGIDAPEAGQAFGTVAKHALSEKVFEQFVRVEWRESDKYGRTLGHVYLDSRHINLELVAEGHAWHFKEYSSDPQLAHAENVARQQRLGLWSDSSPVAPWDFRHPPTPAKTVAQPRAPPAKQQATSHVNQQLRKPQHFRKT